MELQSGGFGSWAFVERAGTSQIRKPCNPQIDKEEVPKKTSLEEYKRCMRSLLDAILATKDKATLTIEKGITDYPSDLDLRSMPIELVKIFKEQNEETGCSENAGVDEMNNNVEGDETPCDTMAVFAIPHSDESGKKTNTSDRDGLDSGLQIVPRTLLYDDKTLESPTVIKQIDNSIEAYKKSKSIGKDDYPKFDLIKDSPTTYIPSPRPLTTIKPVNKELFSMKKDIKKKVDAPRDGKRETKTSFYLRSPYFKRCVDVEAGLSAAEKKIFSWVNACVEPIDLPVFQTTTGAASIRGTIESLCDVTHIFANVIDSWAALLNHEEKSRSKDSPRRFFMHTAILTQSMVAGFKNYDDTYKLFCDNMLSALGKDLHLITFKDLDLVFFPIHKDHHFYAVVFNLKTPAFLIIDNLHDNVASPSDEQKITSTLHFLFTDHLNKVGHPAYDAIAGLDAVKIGLKWATKENSVDCGVFLMRHMESYKGEVPYKWKCGLDVEGKSQTKQLQMLRSKYAAKLLLSDINLRRPDVIEKCERFNDLDIHEKSRILMAADQTRAARLASI